MKAILLIIVITFTAFSQQRPRPCSSPENRAFDFWIGEWKVTDKSGEKEFGHSLIQLVSGECVLLENWTSKSGYTGKSLNYYNKRLKKWEQKWIGADGNPIEFIGEAKSDAIYYTAITFDKEGKEVKNKLTFTKLGNDLVRQFWEQSSDNGTTWQAAFDGYYNRIK